MPGSTASSASAVSGTAGTRPDLSIAVLPFINRSRGEEDEYFSDGLADELLSVLSKVRGLRVAARASSFQFKGTSEDVAVIGEKLNVATLLDGSVRKAGNRVRISVQLVQASDRVQLWSETYDRSLDDIFAVQDDIAQSVVKELRTTLLGDASDSGARDRAQADVAGAPRGHGTNPEAHRLYLQGKYFVERLSEEDTTKGLRFLNDAVALDSTHAAAWTEIGRAYTNLGGYGWQTPAVAFRQARDAVQRALEIEPGMAEAYVRLATIQRNYDWDWKGAEASTRRAVELAPGNAEVLRARAGLAHALNRLEEAEGYLQRAIEQDPLHVGGHFALGQVYRSMDRAADAERCFWKAIELVPQRISTRFVLGIVIAKEGRDAEAMALINQEPAEWGRLTALALAHHLAGRKAESDRALEQLKAKYSVEAAYQIAAVHAARGDSDEAFHWLERSIIERDAGLAQLLSEPTFRSIHADPRWRATLEKIGLGAWA